jgi:hypothetical protein
MEKVHEELLNNQTESVAEDATADVYSEVATVAHTEEYKIEDDTVQTGGCDAWMTYWKGGDMEYHSIVLKASKLSLATISRTGTTADASNRDTLDDFSDPIMIECHDQTSMEAIVGQITQLADTLSNAPIVCGNHEWVIDTCSGQDQTDTPIVCVDCGEKLLANMCSYTDGKCDDELDGAMWTNPNTTLLAPCAESTCARRAGHSTARVILAEFVERAPAPDMVSVNVSVADDNSLVVNATLSASGTMYCSAYRSNMEEERPTDAQSIMLDNNVASTSYYGGLGEYKAIVNIRSEVFIPITTYNVTCLTISEEGTAMTFDDALTTSSEVIPSATTSCCKDVSVSVEIVSFMEDEDQPDAAMMKIDFLPTTDLTLTLSLVEYDVNGVLIGPVSSAVLPETVQLKASSTDAELSQSVAFKAISGGWYKFNVALSGTDTAEYSISTSTDLDVTVIGLNEEPPTPQVGSVLFANDGRYFDVVFSGKTNRAGITGGSFACSEVLTFSSAESATCKWNTEGNRLSVSPSATGDEVSIGDPISLLANSTQAYCTAKSSSADPTCSTWAYTPEGNFTLSAPDKPVLPTVAIASPSVIGGCDDLPFDLSSSGGSARRAWDSVAYAVTASGVPQAELDALILWLEVDYVFSPPKPIPKSLLTPGYRYNIRATLCNFLGGCSEATHQTTVLKNIKPVAIIPGRLLRTVYRPQSLRLSSEGYVVACDASGSSNSSSANLVYSWEVYEDGVLRTDIVSTSRSTSKFVLRPYTLEVGSVYEIVLSVYSNVYLSSGTASIQVVVGSSGLEAGIVGGAMRSVKPSGSTPLSAASSKDLDVDYDSASDAEKLVLLQSFTYSWECYQMKPTLSTTCGVTLAVSSSSPWLANANAKDSTPGSESKVWVVVSNSQGVSSKAELTVIGLNAGAPVVEASSVTANYVNPSEKIKLQATVDAAALATAVWSINDDSGVDLASSALTKTSRTVSSGITTLYLALNPSVLPEGQVFTFTLLATMSSGGETGTASVVVETNSPPLPGVLTSNPSVGMELDTKFVLSASLWEDDDIPLSYALYFIDPRSVSAQSVKTRSEVSFGSTKLPAGLESENNGVTIGVYVYDLLDAVSSATGVVTVNVTTMTLAEKQALVTSSVSGGEDMTVDETKQAVSIGTSIINLVDCSMAPNCTYLERDNCVLIENTCGACKNGYIADQNSYGNTRCQNSTKVSQYYTSVGAAATDDAAASGSGDACVADGDCPVFEKCSAVGVCEKALKGCPGDCNGNGYCGYVDLSSEEALLSCYEGDSSCKSGCVCDEGLNGKSCLYDDTEISDRRSLRDRMIESFARVVDSEDSTADTIEAWTGFLSSLVQNPDELSGMAVEIIGNLTTSVLQSARDVGMPYEKVLSLLEIADTVVELRDLVVTNETDASTGRRLFAVRRRLEDDRVYDSIASNVDSMGDLISGDMVVGQSSVESIQASYRMCVQATSIGANTAANFSVPRTALEESMGTQVPSLSISPPNSTDDSTDRNLKVTLSSTKASVFRTGTYDTAAENLTSNALKIRLNCMEANAADSKVLLTVPHIKEMTFGESLTERLNFTTACRRKIAETFTYFCPETETYHDVACNGTKRFTTFTCPRLVQARSCSVLDHQVNGEDIASEDPDAAAAASNCTVIEELSDNWQTTCECNLCSAEGAAIARRARRRRLLAESDPSSYNVYANEGYRKHRRLDGDADGVEGINLVGTAQFIGEQYASIISDAGSYNSKEAILGTIMLLIAFAGAWIGFPIFIVVSRTNKTVIMTAYRKMIGHDLEEKKGADMHILKEGNKRRGGVAAVNGDNGPVAEAFTEYIDSIIPDLFTSDDLSWYNRMWNEMINGHPITECVNEEDFTLRVMKIMHFLCEQNAAFFTLAVLFDLQYPVDNGSCAGLGTTEDLCMAQTTFFDDTRKACEWDPVYQECLYVEPEIGLEALIVITILLSIVWLPFQLATQWVFSNVLLAPTAQEIDTMNVIEKVRSVGAIFHANGSAESKAQAAEAGLEMTGTMSSSGVRRLNSGNLKVLVQNNEKTRVLTKAVLADDGVMENMHLASAELISRPLAQALLRHMRVIYSKGHPHYNKNVHKLTLSNGGVARSYRKGGSNHYSSGDARFLYELVDYMRNAGHFRSKATMKAKEQEVQTLMTDALRTDTSGKRRAGLEIRTRDRKMLTEITQSAIARFRHNLLRHRHSLEYKEKVREFDSAWHLSMIRGDGVNKSDHSHQYFFSSSAEAIMNDELEDTMKNAKKQYRLIKKLPPSFRGAELLRRFVLDVVGRRTEAGVILKNQLYQDVDKRVVSWTIKCSVAAMMFVVQLYFIFSVLLYGANKGRDWQIALITSMMLNFVIEQLVTSLVTTFVLMYAIPSIVADDIKKARQSIHDHIQQLFAVGGDARATMDRVLKQSQFSAGEYMFSSNCVALAVPELFESVLVLSYRTPLPPSAIAKSMTDGELGNYASKVSIEKRMREDQEVDKELMRRLPDADMRGEEARALRRKLYMETILNRVSSRFISILMSVGLWIGTMPLGLQSFVMDTAHPLIITCLGYGFIWYRALSLADKILFTAGVFLLVTYPYWRRFIKRLTHTRNAIAPAPEDEGQRQKREKKERKAARDAEEAARTSAMVSTMESIKNGVSGATPGAAGGDIGGNWEDNLSDLGSIKSGTNKFSSTESDNSSVSSLTSLHNSSSTESTGSIDTDDLEDEDFISDDDDDIAEGEDPVKSQVKFAADMGIMASPNTDDEGSAEVVRGAEGTDDDRRHRRSSRRHSSILKSDGKDHRHHHRKHSKAAAANSIHFDNESKEAPQQSSNTYEQQQQRQQQRPLEAHEQEARESMNKSKTQVVGGMRVAVRPKMTPLPSGASRPDIATTNEDVKSRNSGKSTKQQQDKPLVKKRSGRKVGLVHEPNKAFEIELDDDDLSSSSGSNQAGADAADILGASMYDIDFSDDDGEEEEQEAGPGGHRVYQDESVKQVDKMFKRIFSSGKNGSAAGATTEGSSYAAGSNKVKVPKGTSLVEAARLQEKEDRIRKEALAHAALIGSAADLDSLTAGLNAGVGSSDPFIAALADNSAYDFLSDEHRLEFEQMMALQRGETTMDTPSIYLRAKATGTGDATTSSSTAASKSSKARAGAVGAGRGGAVSGGRGRGGAGGRGKGAGGAPKMRF